MAFTECGGYLESPLMSIHTTFKPTEQKLGKGLKTTNHWACKVHSLPPESQSHELCLHFCNDLWECFPFPIGLATYLSDRILYHILSYLGLSPA